VRLGVHLGYWGLSLDRDGQRAVAQEAERLGFDSLWVAEAYGSDAASILGWLAAQTTRIRLGSAIFQIPARSAAMTAMTAATLDRLSDGRMILGLGPSGPQVSEGWHGVRFAKQLARTRDYVAAVRIALARERLEYCGETLELPLPDGPGKALKLTIEPVQKRIPIYLAAIGPKATALAGEVADGWIPTLLAPEHLAALRRSLIEGAEAGRRSLEGFDVAPNVNVLVSDDHAAARDDMRGQLALYIGGMGSRERNFYNRLVVQYGFEHAAREVQDLYLGGRKKDAAAAVPDELIDMVCLCGPEDQVRRRLATYRDAGVGTLGITPMGEQLGDRLAQLATIARLLADLPAPTGTAAPSRRSGVAAA
jgi:F420-dependent oxidoreductase-like protein